MPIAIALTVAALWGQSNSSIIGTVTDQASAVVPRAAVTVTENSTGLVHRAQTNDTGVFQVVNLLPGEYSVNVQANGFKALEIQAVQLETSQARDLGKLQLALGAVSEQVSVTAEVTAVQTASSERSADIDGNQLNDVALKGRDTLGMLALIPGVLDTNANRSLAGSGSMGGISINGNTGGGGGSAPINYQVDGANVSDMEGGIYIDPSVDSVAELKVLTSGYQAEYGRNSEGVINAVTKAGSRSYHGTFSWDHRNEGLNANDFFNNRSGVQRPIYRYFIGAATVGGPVYIPKHFNTSKSKLFFFWSEEFTQVAQPTVTTTANEPTAAMRGGDFSQALTATGALIPVKDPNTGLPFSGNIIPKSRIDPTGLAYLNFLPLPTGYVNPAPGQQFTANSLFSATPWLRRRNDIVRLDWNPFPKLSVYGRYAHDKNDSQLVNTVSNGLGTLIKQQPGTSYLVDAVYTVTPTMVNEAKVAISGNQLIWDYPAGQDGSAYYRTSALNPPTLSTVPSGALYLPYLPYATYAGGSATNLATFQDYLNGGNSGQAVPTATGGGANRPVPYAAFAHTHTYQDDLTKIIKNHTVKAGFYLETNRKYQPAAGGNIYQGAFNFGSSTNNPLDTGYGYSNALLGVFQSYDQSTVRLVPDQNFTEIEFYVQDNWRVTPRLTLDAGLRFYNMGLESDSASTKAISYLYPQLYTAASAPIIYSEATVGGKTVAVNPVTGATTNASLYNTIVPGSGNPADGFMVNGLTGNGDFTHLPALVASPRLGFAYKLTSDGKTSVRGSAGIFPDRPNQTWLNGRGQPPASLLNYVYNSTISQIPAAAAAAAVTPLTGFALESGSQRVAHSMQMNFTIQRNVGFDTVVDLGYVGNLDRNAVTTGHILNPVPLGVYGTPAGVFGTTELNANLLRASYKGLGQINFQCDCLSDLNYHALQASANHRLSHGLQFNVTYVFSHALGSTASDPYHTDRGWSYGPTTTDRRQIATMQWVYRIPTFTTNKFAKAVLGNWTLSSITHMSTGAAASPACTSTNGGIALTDPSLSGVAARCQITGDLNSGFTKSFYQQFNTAALALAPTGTFGNAGLGILRMPTTWNTDATLNRDILLGSERRKLQMRFEAYNVFNHTEFSAYGTTLTLTGGVNTSTTYGQMTTALPARVLATTLRFEW
jgi:hypothetical protein